MKHMWFKPSDHFGPIAGLYKCSVCNAKWFFLYVDSKRPDDGCPAEAEKFLNQDEFDKLNAGMV